MDGLASSACADAVRITEHVEHMGSPGRRRAETILGQVRALDAVVREHGMDFARDHFDQGSEDFRSDPAIGLLVQLGVGEHRRRETECGDPTIPELVEALPGAQITDRSLVRTLRAIVWFARGCSGAARGIYTPWLGSGVSRSSSCALDLWSFV
jgi:hypothetical protein